jgi:hypothetical protein
LALEIGIAAVIVIGLWRLINNREARFWAWRPRGGRSALGVAVKMLGLYLFAAVLTAILPILTHVFDVQAESGLGAAFLVAEAAAAGLASMTFAGRKAAARQEVAERDEEDIASWLERALTACFTLLAEDARAGVRGRLAEGLASDEHRLRLLGALRDYAKDAKENDESTIRTAVLFMTDWPILDRGDQETILSTVRDFVVEHRIARRRLITKNPKRGCRKAEGPPA